MPKTKLTSADKGPTQQIAIRLDPDVISRLDAIATKLSRPGLSITRTDAIRVALLNGLHAIEKER
jgi:predicted transcriptional regulator